MNLKVGLAVPSPSGHGARIPGARPVPGRSADENAKAPGLILWLLNNRGRCAPGRRALRSATGPRSQRPRYASLHRFSRSSSECFDPLRARTSRASVCFRLRGVVGSDGSFRLELLGFVSRYARSSGHWGLLLRKIRCAAYCFDSRFTGKLERFPKLAMKLRFE